MFQDVCERAGFGRDRAPRDLRHTFVSLLSDDGMAIEWPVISATTPSRVWRQAVETAD